MKRLLLSTALLLLFVGVASANTVFGPDTSSTVTAYAYGYEIPGAIALGGFATGTGYSLNFVGAIYCGGGGSWYWCSGGEYSFEPYLTNGGLSFGYNYPNGTIAQATDGSIVLSFVLDDGSTANFDLADDPVQLDTLTGTESIGLTVTGGCDSAGTTCSTSTSTTPEPTSLLLLGSGLALSPGCEPSVPRRCSIASSFATAPIKWFVDSPAA